MKQIVTTAIVLSRIDYGEADRIIVVITPDHGKLSLMAKAVRREKSKLAGGIELFSVSEITFIKGRGEVSTLISARLAKNYSQIIKEVGRVQTGYDIISKLHKATESETEPEYFELLKKCFEALDEDIDIRLINCWFDAQMLKLDGHAPNLTIDKNGEKLDSSGMYNFDVRSATFELSSSGSFGADQIKFLRLLLSDYPPQVLAKVLGRENLLTNCYSVISHTRQYYAI